MFTWTFITQTSIINYLCMDDLWTERRGRCSPPPAAKPHKCSRVGLHPPGRVPPPRMPPPCLAFPPLSRLISLFVYVECGSSGTPSPNCASPPRKTAACSVSACTVCTVHTIGLHLAARGRRETFFEASRRPLPLGERDVVILKWRQRLTSTSGSLWCVCATLCPAG